MRAGTRRIYELSAILLLLAVSLLSAERAEGSCWVAALACFVSGHGIGLNRGLRKADETHAFLQELLRRADEARDR